MRPKVGLRPVTPHIAAGIRTEPPVSPPKAPSAVRDTTATPEPPEEPPMARAEMSVLTVSVGRELIHVKCAEVDRTRLVEAPDGGRRDRGRLDEHAGPDRRDPPLPVEGVLVGQRYPVQRPPPTPRCHLSVGAVCHLQGAVGLNADVTVEFRLELGDALEHRLRERSRREVALAQRGAGRREGEFGDWDVH